MVPVITKMEVYPVAGHDSMLLNLSGGHAPYFTRNIVILTDSEGNTGVGEVPGGPKITTALENVSDIVVGTKVSDYRNTLLKVQAELDKSGEKDERGAQTFDLRTGVHVLTAIEAPCLDLLGKALDMPVCRLLGAGQQRDFVRFLGYLFFVGCLISPKKIPTANGIVSAMKKPSMPNMLWPCAKPPRINMVSRISN